MSEILFKTLLISNRKVAKSHCLRSFYLLFFVISEKILKLNMCTKIRDMGQYLSKNKFFIIVLFQFNKKKI